MPISFHPPAEIGVFGVVNIFSYAHCFSFSYKEWNGAIGPKVFHTPPFFYPPIRIEVCEEGECFYMSIVFHFPTRIRVVL